MRNVTIERLQGILGGPLLDAGLVTTRGMPPIIRQVDGICGKDRCGRTGEHHRCLAKRHHSAVITLIGFESPKQAKALHSQEMILETLVE